MKKLVKCIRRDKIINTKLGEINFKDKIGERGNGIVA